MNIIEFFKKWKHSNSYGTIATPLEQDEKVALKEILKLYLTPLTIVYKLILLLIVSILLIIPYVLYTSTDSLAYKITFNIMYVISNFAIARIYFKNIKIRVLQKGNVFNQVKFIDDSNDRYSISNNNLLAIRYHYSTWRKKPEEMVREIMYDLSTEIFDNKIEDANNEKYSINNL